MKAKASQRNKFIRIVTIPYRALCKARDFYVRSMMNCANQNIIGLQGTSQAPSLPKSFSVRSARSIESDEDYRELVRAASGRSIGRRDFGLDSSFVKQDARMKSGSRGGPRAMPPRSVSLAMVRIDEERPCCYFGEDVIISGNYSKVVDLKSELKYPRSKSHAVTRTGL